MRRADLRVDYVNILLDFGVDLDQPFPSHLRSRSGKYQD